jgi:phosphoribosylaminoimidazole-succinocarboxamide synthase
MKMRMDAWLADTIKAKTLELYQYGHDFFKKHGILLADCKFEFGTFEGRLYLIDEMLTPDSSRLWNWPTTSPGAPRRALTSNICATGSLSPAGTAIPRLRRCRRT